MEISVPHAYQTAACEVLWAISGVLRYELKFDAATKTMDAAFPALVCHLKKRSGMMQR